MTTTVSPPPSANLSFPAALLQPLLEVSLTAINLLRPVYAPDSHEIQDFNLEYLNPAGQRIMSLPEQPGGTLLSHLPHALATGIFAFYCYVFKTGESARYKLNYPHDGLDQHFHLAAQRCGEQLLVSFSADALHPDDQAEARRRELQRVV